MIPAFFVLEPYRLCHEYHFAAEISTFRQVNRYYINHCNALIPDISADQPNVIPDGWYKHYRQDVDISTKKSAVKDAVKMWVDWEKSSKECYEEIYKEFLDNNEIASANLVMDIIKDVDKELKKAQRHHLTLVALNYDMDSIIDMQDKYHKKYKKKMKKDIHIDIC